jgi:serine/threonine protein kinase
MESTTDLSSQFPLFAHLLSAEGYTLESEIGCGGQAIVYRCHCDRDSETYAVKISHAAHELTVPAELEALQVVWNPHVINVFGTFIAEGFRFIILEFCPGGSVHDLLQEGPMPAQRLWGLGHQVIEALAACHVRGVAHLDIKPQNILIDRHGRAKLCDFGLAKRAGNGELSDQFKGSVAFMAPEIMRKHVYDPFAADVWSLGVTFYVCATGHLPWPTTAKEFFAGVAKGLEKVDEMVPEDFAAVLKMMIVPDPDQRARLEDLVPIFAKMGGKEQKHPKMSSFVIPSVGFAKRSHRMGADYLRLKYIAEDSTPSEETEEPGVVEPGVAEPGRKEEEGTHETKEPMLHLLQKPAKARLLTDPGGRRASYSPLGVVRLTF